jgi:glucose-6-phosphate 1-dehydrogenase
MAQVEVKHFTERGHDQSVTLGAPKGEEALIAIFGASGDLTARKLIPALYRLWTEGFLTDRAPIVGVARRDKSDDAFRQEMAEAVRENVPSSSWSDAKWKNFAKRLYYHKTDIEDANDFVGLRKSLEDYERQSGVRGKQVVYLATTPDLFTPAVESMAKADMIPPANSGRTLRVVFEKPYGHDLKSAQQLTRDLGRYLCEDCIYRIDHYLGKETVQNILLFRFGNAIFEPLFNRNHVAHVQITVAESQGIERGRGGYYDKAGATRDVLQNHMLQLLCLVAMEPPAFFRADEIRGEKLKVLQALAPGRSGPISEWAIPGQYTAGTVDGKPVPGYRQEDRIPKDSRRETFAAMEVKVDNWRWAGVPFFLRTGKRLPERVTEIAIEFKLPPLNLFTTVECEGDICDLVGARPNTLLFRIQPSESISLSFSTKRPGMQYQIHPVEMDFAYESAFHGVLPEAYERLLLDVLRGDSTLFTRSDELEAAWRFVSPVLEHWENSDVQPEPYAPNTWGPAAADQLLDRLGFHWRDPVL